MLLLLISLFYFALVVAVVVAFVVTFVVVFLLVFLSRLNQDFFRSTSYIQAFTEKLEVLLITKYVLRFEKKEEKI